MASLWGKIARFFGRSEILVEHSSLSEQLVQAAFNGDIELVVRILDSGVPIDSAGQNWSPLHAAIENEQNEIVKLLVDRGAELELQNAGLTAIAHAVDIAIDGTHQTGGHPGEEPTEVILTLLNAGADPRPGLVVAREYQADAMIEILEGFLGL